MLEDKLRATDWEATNEAIEEQVARDSYLQWLRDSEKRDKALARVSCSCKLQVKDVAIPMLSILDIKLIPPNPVLN